MAEYSFRNVTAADLPMLEAWLNQPAVTAWWPDPQRQLDGISEGLTDPATTMLIVLRDGLPVAYAQHSVAAHWQEPHYDAIEMPAGTVAMDVFAGPDGMGLGAEWLDALARHLLATAPALIIDPDPANTRAIRAYEKAGFTGDRIVPNHEGKPARMMTRHR